MTSRDTPTWYCSVQRDVERELTGKPLCGVTLIPHLCIYILDTCTLAYCRFGHKFSVSCYRTYHSTRWSFITHTMPLKKSTGGQKNVIQEPTILPEGGDPTEVAVAIIDKKKRNLEKRKVNLFSECSSNNVYGFVACRTSWRA